jgi:hypothetical protein
MFYSLLVGTPSNRIAKTPPNEKIPKKGENEGKNSKSSLYARFIGIFIVPAAKVRPSVYD